VLCVFGIIGVAGAMVLQHRRGEASQHMASLGWVLAGCVLLGAASGIVGALI
jgi:hypothetical protein